MNEILAEGRKFRISLVLSNQFPDQLDKDIQNSVLKNVSTLSVFNLDQQDSTNLSKLFNDKLTAENIMNLPRFKGYFRTPNPYTFELEHMDLQVIDYKTQTPTHHTQEDLWKHNQKCLQKYGESTMELYQRHLKKRNNPISYFLQNSISSFRKILTLSSVK